MILLFLRDNWYASQGQKMNVTVLQMVALTFYKGKSLPFSKYLQCGLLWQSLVTVYNSHSSVFPTLTFLEKNHCKQSKLVNLEMWNLQSELISDFE